jgi:hypothetical protein
MIRVDSEASAADQLRSMLECVATATATERPVDVVDDMREGR